MIPGSADVSSAPRLDLRVVIKTVGLLAWFSGRSNAGLESSATGKLQSLTTRNSRGISDYILYSFELVDARTSAIVWQDFAEIKKQGLEDASYR